LSDKLQEALKKLVAGGSAIVVQSFLKFVVSGVCPVVLSEPT
jgi:hypothetical protein